MNQLDEEKAPLIKFLKSLKIKIPKDQENLFFQSFCHSSWCNEQKDKIESYQRLEFLGDSILNFCITLYLYKKYPDISEGSMSKIRSKLVQTKTIGFISHKLDFGNWIKLGKGERDPLHNSIKNLADVFEALIAAIYLSSGLNKVIQFLKNHYFINLYYLDFEEIEDYKTRLQEYLQSFSLPGVDYIYPNKDLTNQKIFRTFVIWNKNKISEGTGKNKKEAEQKAAKNALNYFLKKNLSKKKS
ncbi:ribonuclease III [symbiont of Argiope bruennichi]|uniref:ribonuclease III n=1 Tax=symbiont of Argiope bruennichi TaxID=2810479 RepID=UPI003DA1DDCC